MFVKLTSGFAQLTMISQNLILQGFCIPGNKLCKPEVTFAIHHEQINIYPTNQMKYL